MSDVSLRVSVLLSVQRALLGAIGPSVRAVLCCWTTASINVRVVFDGPISEHDLETMSIVETEVISDFPDCDVRVLCVRIDQVRPIELDASEVVVFRRQES